MLLLESSGHCTVGPSGGQRGFITTAGLGERAEQSQEMYEKVKGSIPHFEEVSTHKQILSLTHTVVCDPL